MRGDVHHLKAPRKSRGHEQQGARYAVVLQADDLEALSTVVVAPTSTAPPEGLIHPEIRVRGRRTRVLTEQLAAADWSRLGPAVGRLTHDEMVAVDDALRAVLSLD